MLKAMGSPSNNSPPKEPDPLNPQKQQLHLVIDYWSSSKSIDAAQ